MENYFAVRGVGERYARRRPYFHTLVVERLGELVGSPRFAVDVGCGTGLSTAALIALAKSAVGVDPSLEMLSRAPEETAGGLAAGAAEALPVRGSTADLVSVASAFHWFDRARFLPEVVRVLRAGGWLCIYDNWFEAELRGEPGFARWWNRTYLPRFPSPPRDRRPFTGDEARSYGLHLAQEATFQNEVEMDLDDLVSYLSTQTNAIAAFESGRVERREWEEWLRAELRRFFGESAATFFFGTGLRVYRKVG